MLTGVFNFASNAMFAVFVLYAVGPTSAMGLTDPAYGLLLTSAAAGSLLGSFVAERVERTPRPVPIVGADRPRQRPAWSALRR